MGAGATTVGLGRPAVGVLGAVGGLGTVGGVAAAAGTTAAGTPVVWDVAVSGAVATWPLTGAVVAACGPGVASGHQCAEVSRPAASRASRATPAPQA